MGEERGVFTHQLKGAGSIYLRSSNRLSRQLYSLRQRKSPQDFASSNSRSAVGRGRRRRSENSASRRCQITSGQLMARPSSQLLGSGFGKNGSTWNCGAPALAARTGFTIVICAITGKGVATNNARAKPSNSGLEQLKSSRFCYARRVAA